MMVRHMPGSASGQLLVALLALSAACLPQRCSSQGLNVGTDVLGATAQATATQFGEFEDLLTISTTGDKPPILQLLDLHMVPMTAVAESSAAVTLSCQQQLASSLQHMLHCQCPPAGSRQAVQSVHNPIAVVIVLFV